MKRKRPWHFYPVGTGQSLCRIAGDGLWTGEIDRVTCRRCLSMLKKRDPIALAAASQGTP